MTPNGARYPLELIEETEITPKPFKSTTSSVTPLLSKG
jgi:hypothetical protein